MSRPGNERATRDGVANEPMSKTALVIPPVINGAYEYVALASLKHHPKNVRQSDLGAIYESIRANGFYGACVVQKSTNYILVGNHRVAASRELGIPAVPVVFVDCDNDAALRIMLSDNRTGDLATDNPAALAELLAELAGTDKGLSGTGFDGDDLDSLLTELTGPDFDPVGIDEQGRLDEKAKVTCPECKHEFSPS